MKKIFYNNLIAKMLIGCHTITIGPFILTEKKTKEELGQETINHETCHSIQWIELLIVTSILIFIIQLLVGISPWWYLLSTISFYIWYTVEYLIRLIMLRNHKKAYKSICFEKEASESESDQNYIENRLLFSWTKYLSNY